MADPPSIFCAMLAAAFAANLVSVLAGFGGNLIFIPMMALLLGIRDAALLGLVLGNFMPMLVVARHHQHAQGRIVVRMILLALPGVAVGLIAHDRAPEVALELLVAVVALIAGWRTLRTGNRPPPAPRRGWSLLLPAGGFVQSAVATSGPLFVAWLAATLHDKTAFRSTLCLFWCVLNPLVTTAALLFSAEPARPLIRAAYCLPVVLLAFIVGDRLHERIPLRQFRIWVAVILLVSGAAMLARAASP